MTSSCRACWVSVPFSFNSDDSAPGAPPAAIAASDAGVAFTEITILGNQLRYMMRDNFPTFANDLPLPDPGPPANYVMRGTFSNFELDANANVVWVLQTTDIGGGPMGTDVDHTGVYYNRKLIHNSADDNHTLAGIENPYFVPDPNNPPDLSNWGYNRFNAVNISNDGRILMFCRLDSNGTSTGGNPPDALILVEIDAVGNILKETLLALNSSGALSTNIKSSNGI